MMAERRGEPKIGGAQAPAGGERGLAQRDILAGVPAVGALSDPRL